MTNPLTWGSLEWYYFIENHFGDIKGIVEYLSEFACADSTPNDVKLLGILCMIIIALIVGHRNARIFKDKPRKKP